MGTAGKECLPFKGTEKKANCSRKKNEAPRHGTTWTDSENKERARHKRPRTAWAHVKRPEEIQKDRKRTRGWPGAADGCMWGGEMIQNFWNETVVMVAQLCEYTKKN